MRTARPSGSGRNPTTDAVPDRRGRQGLGGAVKGAGPSEGSTPGSSISLEKARGDRGGLKGKRIERGVMNRPPRISSTGRGSRRRQLTPGVGTAPWHAGSASAWPPFLRLAEGISQPGVRGGVVDGRGAATFLFLFFQYDGRPSFGRSTRRPSPKAARKAMKAAGPQSRRHSRRSSRRSDTSHEKSDSRTGHGRDPDAATPASSDLGRIRACSSARIGRNLERGALGRDLARDTIARLRDGDPRLSGIRAAPLSSPERKARWRSPPPPQAGPRAARLAGIFLRLGRPPIPWGRGRSLSQTQEVREVFIAATLRWFISELLLG